MLEKILTDPQIMTKPDLGSSLFGDGNLGEAFSRFTIEHEFMNAIGGANGLN